MAGSTPGLPLPFPSSPESPADWASPAGDAALWLALVFPRLALEVITVKEEGAPCAAAEQAGGRRRIHTASQAAEAKGVAPGMPVNAAYALCPALQVHALDAAAQQARLEQLAHWAGRYTSQVCLIPPRALLLEIRGSLRLFGGPARLHAQITGELSAQWSHEFRCAAAPTPAAGLLLAENGVPALITDCAALRSALGPMPVSALPLDKRRQRQLGSAGIRILRDLWRLPAADLARRFGPELTNSIDRILGRRPDPRAAIAFPEHFEAALPLPGEVQDHALLLAAAGQLIDELIDFLRARDAAIDHCLLRLHHPQRPITTVRAGLREASRDGGRLLQVLAERLHRLALEAPVTTIELMTNRLQPYTGVNASLLMLPDARSPLAAVGDDITSLLEQLQARLGRAAVRGLHVVEDLRPERALRLGALSRSSCHCRVPGRPLWLLPRPRPLARRDGQPRCGGALRIIAGPERIETGWWDGDDVRRDYFIAADSEGRRLWVFRDLRDRGWYLHGLFG